MNKNNCCYHIFNIKNKYCKILLSALRQTHILLKVSNLCQRIIYVSTQQAKKLNFQRFTKLFFLLTLLICLLFGQVGTAQTPHTDVLVELGIKDYNAGNFFNAIKNWQEALNQYKNNPSATGVVNENLARAYQQIGENKEAIASLEAAIRDYGAVENIQQVGRMKSELAQVYSNLGQPRKAIALLCGQLVDKSKNQVSQELKCTPESAEQIASKFNDKRGQVAALGILAEAYRLIGSYDQAIKYLDAAQQVTPEYQFLVFNSLGIAYKSRGQLRELQADSAMMAGVSSKEQELTQKSLDDYNRAYQYFQDSIKFARKEKQAIAEMRGLLNLIQLASETNHSKFINDGEFNKTFEDALNVLESLPNSATKVYGEIDLAYLQRNTKGTSPFTYCPTEMILSSNNRRLNLLENSVLTSKQLQDKRLISYANGALGHFWECQKNNEKALKYTQSAIIAADNKLSAKDSLYLWEWQAGRILDAQNQKQDAIASYQRAFDTLEDIRQDILTAERDVQFDFRDVVRPLYRTLAQSRLDLLGVGAIADEQRVKELSKVVNTIDALKLAELQNYFGNDCILSGLNPKSVGELLEDNSVAFQNTGFLSSIILDGKTGILLQLPNQATKFKWIEDPNQQGTTKIVSSDTLEKKIAEFRKGLVSKEEINYDKTIAAHLYDWIIRPFADDIKSQKIKTLVFIQDGFLRSVPMAALYDSQQQKYLVETYAVATTPSLRLTKPKLRDRTMQKALILGLTKEATIDGKTFDALFAVPNEISAIERIFPDHTPLIDDNFIPENFQQKLDQTRYSIVHIASHAQFGIIPEDTFIVTGKNQKLTISQLETSLRNLNNKSDSVELLTLTACETAVGDDRATLGLAGVALQVGVKSAIASLWSVSDESTSEIVKTFYINYRHTGMSIAQALQTAQMRMINAKKLPSSENINPLYDHPAYWAPIIAIGNWL
ncbi:CHAT domain-containing protein [Tolypothrix sp. LEGE 11397]|nr:CHAT domain-containing protein [Tolypothrix sp. LEGE 11397]UYD25359.1 CHAT domain-containing protein [Tolypothrix sp. PCC 7712]UYD32396.1 CHAT domain-containing protein [Tolypothrix sp. PCC 7601]BAY91290.1 TPR repeat protein [Microchaete diplosiphon NIES-3275]